MSPELKLATDSDNANLILVWPRHLFQQKNMKVLYCQNYQCWSPKNALPVYCHRICLQFKYQYLKSWKICYPYTVIKFVCSWRTSRKNIIVKFKRIFRHYYVFQLHTYKMNHKVYEICLSKYKSNGMSSELQF